MQIKDIATTTAKWVSNAARSVNAYVAGIQSPRRPWMNATMKAFDVWVEGVNRAIANRSFVKGVQRVGDAAWMEKCISLGAQRYGPGVNAAQDAYREGFEPYHAVLASLILPERYARGDERNIERVRKIALALHEKRMSLLAG